MSDQAEVAERVPRLGAEHDVDFGPAMLWLVDHGSDARLAVRALAGFALRRRADVITKPWRGLFQRQSASTEAIWPVEASTIGW